MSMRLQVLLSDSEMLAIRKQAEGERLSVGEYVRRTLREAEALRTARSDGAKLATIRKVAGYSFPTADIEQMNSQIEQGYSG